LTLFHAQQSILRREMDIGRGGTSVAPFPIELEPPFRPFKHPSGRRDTQRTTIPKPNRVPPPTDMCFVRVRLSPDDAYNVEVNEQLLLALGRREIASFEFVGTGGNVHIQFVYPSTEVSFLIAQLRSLFPRAQVFEGEDVIPGASRDSLEVRSYRLRDSNLFQIRTEGRTETLATLAAVLPRIGEGEIGMLQVLFQPVVHPWRDNILTLASDPWEPPKSAFVDLPDLPRKARTKVERPLFVVALRLAASTTETLNALESSFLPQFESLENGFIQARKDYPPDAVTGRLARSTGIILSIRELAAIAHLPDPSSVTGLERAEKTAPAPDVATHDFLVPLGVNSHAGEEKAVGIPEERLVRHLSILGGTGSGKTNLMKFAFQRLLEDGYGMAVLDPKGDLAQGILDLVPKHRIKDVIWFDPTDREHPPSLNILQASEDVEPEDLAAELMIGLKRLMPDSLRVGQRMETVLRNALMTLIVSKGEKTLNDVRRFLEEEGFRKSVLATVDSPDLISYWERRKLSRSVVEPVITRLSAFLDRPSIKNIVGVPNKIDIQRAMADKKIFIANLHKGALRDGAYVLGSFLLSRFQLSAMSRPEHDMAIYPILVDEFHVYASHGMDTESIETFLSETRSFQVPLVVSTQFLGRLNRNVVLALLGNLGTQICMRMGQVDAQVLQRELGAFDAEDLLNLEIGQCITRMGTARDSFNVSVPLADDRQSYREEIISRSKELYCRTKEEAERIVSGIVDEPKPEEASERLWVVDAQGLVSINDRQPELASPAEIALAMDSDEDEGPMTRVSPETTPDQKSPYNKDLVTYIEHATRWPFMTISDRDGELGLSRYKSNKVRSELLSANMIRPHKVNTGGRSGQKTIIEVTEAGYLLLNSMGVQAKRPRGRGGFPHRYYAHMLKEYAEHRWTGCAATVEDASYGRPADVTVKIPSSMSGEEERVIAFEVFITGEEKEVTGIAKDVEIFDRVIVCAVSQSELEVLTRRARRSLGDELLGKVDFSLVSDYLDTPKSVSEITSLEPASNESSHPVSTEPKFDVQVLIPNSEVEKSGEKSALELEPEISIPKTIRRRSKKGRLQQIEDAYTHLHDLDRLGTSDLTRLPEVIERINPMQVMAEGQALREMLLEAARQVLKDISAVPGKSNVHYFLEEYLKGKSVSQIADELGVTRSWCSRAYRKEAFQLTSTQFVKLISLEND